MADHSGIISRSPPCELCEGTLDFIACSPHRYRMLLDQKTTRNCHPTYWNGVMLLQREG